MTFGAELYAEGEQSAHGLIVLVYISHVVLPGVIFRC